MRATSIRRLAGGSAALLMAGATVLSMASVATAAPPRWVMTVASLPSQVSPGAPAGYRVVLTNDGPSNISALYLVSNKSATPIYLHSERSGACGDENPPTTSLSCSFGALNAGVSVTITVAYTTSTSGSSFAIQFQANTTGATFSDVKGRSHGDTLTTNASTMLSANKNFAGAFTTSASDVVGNSAQLTGKNKQATKVVGVPVGYDATVEDGPTTTGDCDPARFACSSLFGEWSVVNVNSGNALIAPFQIQITFKTGTPSAFLHSNSATDQELVGQCAGNAAPAPAAVPCFTWAGNTATIYTLRNGSWKGN